MGERSVQEIAGQMKRWLPGEKRRVNRIGNLKSADDSLPLDLGFLEIDERTWTPARGSQIAETLRGRFVAETLGTFDSMTSASSTRTSATYSPAGWPLQVTGNEISAAARMPRRRSSWNRARWRPSAGIPRSEYWTLRRQLRALARSRHRSIHVQSRSSPAHHHKVPFSTKTLPIIIGRR